MQFKISFKNFCASGATVGQIITLYPKHIYTERELLDVIIHESIHAAINYVADTTSKQDHYIIKKLEPEWF